MLTALFLIVHGFILYWIIKPTKQMKPGFYMKKVEEQEQQIEIASLCRDAKLYGLDTASLRKKPNPLSTKPPSR